MKSVALKSIALVTILAFAFMLMPQQAESQVNCADAQAACTLARIVAGGVCAAAPPWCALANEIANAVCSWANGVCNP
jgi:uncharacterized membrane protein YcaP (DUF421 family)